MMMMITTENLKQLQTPLHIDLLRRYISQWSFNSRVIHIPHYFLVRSAVKVTNGIRHIYIYITHCIILLLNMLEINKRDVRRELPLTLSAKVNGKLDTLIEQFYLL
jgi:hypothetical protein